MLLSIRDVSKALKVSERHTRRMIAEGKYPHYRLGHRLIRLELEEIKALTRRPSYRQDEQR